MDEFSEVEIKIDAEKIKTVDFIHFVLNSDVSLVIDEIKILNGTDCFYQKGDDVVRHRCDGVNKKSVLTVKKRKSNKSIVDRHEVDLPIELGTTPDTVSKFLEMSGWSKLFQINKSYHVFKVSSPQYKACVALYDVNKGGKNKRRFLEVEIEKDSKCTHEEGLVYLNSWLERIRTELSVPAEPLNLSLYEYYKDK
jgi:adenylate cyclase class IV